VDPAWKELADDVTERLLGADRLAVVVAAHVIRALADQKLLPPATDWMSTEDAAVYTRWTPKALQHHRALGTGPRFHRVGRLIRYKRQDLDAWLESAGGNPT
jgi:hypothetical protein